MGSDGRRGPDGFQQYIYYADRVVVIAEALARPNETKRVPIRGRFERRYYTSAAFVWSVGPSVAGPAAAER